MPAIVDIASLPVAPCVGARAAATELCGAEASTGPAVAALAAGVSSPASALEPSAGASGTDEEDVGAGDTVGDEGAGAWGASASLSAEPVGGMSFMNQAYPIANRLACPQTPRDMRAPRQDQTGTLPAVDGLISRLSSRPDAALFRAMVKGRLPPCSKVCEECHASRSLFSNRTVARHRRGFRSKHAAAYARRGKSLPRRCAPLLQRCPLGRIPGGILPAGASQSRQSRLPLGPARPRSVKHDPERWIGVFRKDHAQTKAGAGRPIR